MSIVYEGFGNVLTHQAQTITCPVNVVGVMGKGLAATMRNLIQGLEKHYKDLCETGKMDVGKCQIYPIPGKNQQVLLFPSKDHWRNDSTKEIIEKGLINLVENIDNLGIQELAITAVGCGLGNMDYPTEVKPLFEKYLDPLNIDVYILLRDFD